ncbi:MAG: DMT family transporter [Polymorphobacter sp.]|uniref:DMT family transporter n=1 Tax=Polymorphobacter sp. TaxID=1909290 RepID=UPI003A89BCE2
MTSHKFVAPAKAASARPQNGRATAFYLLGILISTAMVWMIKTLGQDYGAFQIMVARGAVMAVVLAPFALMRRAVPRVSGTPLKLAGRSLMAFGGQAMGIAAIAALPLAQAQALGFTKGFLVLALAVLMLGEQVGWRRWAAMALGMLGVLIILEPGQDIDPAGFLALGSAICFAGSTIVVKDLTRDTDRLTLMFWGAAGQSALALPLALIWWVAPPLPDLLIMLCLGLVAILLQSIMLTAFRLGDVSALAPLDYLRLVTGTILGFLAFGEVPGPAVLIGAALIIAANFAASWRPARQAATPRVL